MTNRKNMQRILCLMIFLAALKTASAYEPRNLLQKKAMLAQVKESKPERPLSISDSQTIMIENEDSFN